MKTALQAQMNQQLGMTPQLLQSIRLLHLTSMEIELEVAKALDENPLLERVGDDADATDDSIAAEETPADDIRAEDSAAEEDFDSFDELGDFDTGAGESSGPVSDDYDPFATVAAQDTSGIRGNLRAQLEHELDDANRFAAACWILDQTADTGYLEIGHAQLLADGAAQFHLDTTTIESLRQRILRCEPAGFGACDLRECLGVQLAEKADDTAGLDLAIAIVNDHLDTLGRGDRAALAEALGASDADIATAIALIKTLQPKPGLATRQERDGVIVPDVIVRRRADGWHICLNSRAAPRVRVDGATEKLLSQCGNSPEAKRMRELLAEARWLSHGLSMRYETLLRTVRAIVERQAEFLDRGEEAMRPLILREVAAAIGMHESSISRITTGKYMQTPRGTFELKYFFSARLDGAAVAGVAVRAMVKRLIDTENRCAPLADDTIVALLARRGIHIARRTVAKYRDILHIASAKERGLQFKAAAAAAA